MRIVLSRSRKGIEIRTLSLILAATGILLACANAGAQTRSLEDQILAKYDLNGDGRLDAAELRQLARDLSAARQTPPPKVKRAVPATSPSTGPIKEPTSASLPTLSAAVAPAGCIPAGKALFVRSDPLDNFHYLVDPQAVADAKGASVGYTNNRIAGTQSATITGRISYLLIGEQCDGDVKPFISGIGFAPFISSNGTWDEPIKKTSSSALKFGTDLQFSLSTTEFFVTDHYFYLSPYHQTDFRDLAKIDGISVAYEPVIPALLLNSSFASPYFSFFWQLRGEMDIVDVRDPGLTNLVNGRHTWVGETTRANLALFPLNSAIAWPEWFAGRFSFIGTAQYHWDKSTSTQVQNYSAVLQYKLGDCKKDPTKDLPCSIQGSSALSFEYDWGTDKDTLVNVNQYLIKFSYAY